MAVYPRKQTVVIFAICAIAVTGVAYYVYGQSFAANAIGNQKSQVSAIAETSIDIPDSTDWQKQFLGVATNSAEAFKPATKAAPQEPDEKLTATDVLSRSFLTKYGELNQSGLVNNSGVINEVVGQIASQSVNGLPVPEKYYLGNMIVTESNPASLSAYGKSLLLALREYMPIQNEAAITSQAFSDNDMSELSALDPMIASYKQLVKALLKLPVPGPLAQYHLNLINGFSIALYNTQAFRHMDSDPVQGLAAVSLVPVSIQFTGNAISDIQKYFISVGIPINS